MGTKAGITKEGKGDKQEGPASFLHEHYLRQNASFDLSLGYRATIFNKMSLGKPGCPT